MRGACFGAAAGLLWLSRCFKKGPSDMNTPEFKLAAIQASPVLFDKAASTEKACSLIAEAGRNGADFAAFGESWLPGYPFWVEGGVQDLTWEASANYLENAVELTGPEVRALCDAAHAANIDVVIGVAEKDPFSSGTAFCTAQPATCLPCGWATPPQTDHAYASHPSRRAARVLLLVCAQLKPADAAV